MHRRIIYLSFYTVLFVSCQEQVKKKDYPVHFVKKGTVSIPIDAQTEPLYSEIQYFSGKGEVMIANRLGKQKLYKINLKEEKIIEELGMDQTGPNEKKSNYRHFYYWNKDSIFLIGVYDQKFYLIDEKGIIHSSYPLDIKAPSIKMSTPLINMGYRDASYNHKNQVLTFMAYPAAPGNMESIPDDPVFFHLNLTDSILRPGTPSYALNYKKGYLRGSPSNMGPIVTNNGKAQMVFVFSIQPAIYVYDIKTKSFSKHSFQSDYVKEYPDLREVDLPKAEKYLLESNAHERILYNEEQGLYFLIIDLYTPFINEDTGKKNSPNSKPISILVFNEEFEKIAEKKFRGGIYNVYNSFLTDKGLYLSTSNPNNPNFTEDALTYEFYEIVQE